MCPGVIISASLHDFYNCLHQHALRPSNFQLPYFMPPHAKSLPTRNTDGFSATVASVFNGRQKLWHENKVNKWISTNFFRRYRKVIRTIEGKWHVPQNASYLLVWLAHDRLYCVQPPYQFALLTHACVWLCFNSYLACCILVL